MRPDRAAPGIRARLCVCQRAAWSAHAHRSERGHLRRYRRRSAGKSRGRFYRATTRCRCDLGRQRQGDRRAGCRSLFRFQTRRRCSRPSLRCTVRAYGVDARTDSGSGDCGEPRLLSHRDTDCNRAVADGRLDRTRRYHKRNRRQRSDWRRILGASGSPFCGSRRGLSGVFGWQRASASGRDAGSRRGAGGTGQRHFVHAALAAGGPWNTGHDHSSGEGVR